MAINYFVKSNKELKITKSVIKKNETKNLKNKESENNEFGSIFDVENDIKNDTTTKKENIEQISIFNM